MRRLVVGVLLLSGGCANRNFVERGDGVGVPASSGATTSGAAITPNVAKTASKKNFRPGFPIEAQRGESLSDTPDESLEERRVEPRPALDPNVAPETTNYD